MNHVFSMAILSVLFTVNLIAQGDAGRISSVITQFTKAGDIYDVLMLDELLDDNYRVLMNRMFGSEQVVTLQKSDYLKKVASKEFGGDTRTVEIENMVINGTIASVKVNFTGEKLSYNSIMVLIKDGDNEWKLISDVPYMS